MKFLLLIPLLIVGQRALAATYASDGTQADVQSKWNGAADGDTVTIPSGSFTWTSTLALSGKGTKLQGAGSGRIIGRSTSSVTIGTGTKVFTTQAGLSITPGQSLEIRRTGSIIGALGVVTGDNPVMVGTVSTYSGTTLTMNISAVNGVGSGTQQMWVISTPASTTITKSYNGDFVTVDEDASHNVEISGIRFTQSSGAGEFIWLKPSTGTKPTLIHDCYFEPDSSVASIYSSNNRGVVWNCTFNALAFNLSGAGLHHVANNETASWTSTSTMGTADTTGDKNMYFEDCDFHAMLACDIDNRGRAVFRHCTFNNAQTGSHGADSSNYGVRHIEIYDSDFLFDNVGSESLNLQAYHSSRGGTFVITRCSFIDINSPGAWGDKSEVVLAIQNVERNAGPNPCWGAGVAGIQYPCPRQIGMGRVTGTGLDGTGRSSDAFDYVGDSEPVYMWANTGFSYFVGVTGYSPNECASSDSPASYILAGRDFYNDGTAKLGDTSYTYPHPLRSGGGGGGGGGGASGGTLQNSRRGRL